MNDIAKDWTILDGHCYVSKDLMRRKTTFRQIRLGKICPEFAQAIHHAALYLIRSVSLGDGSSVS